MTVPDASSDDEITRGRWREERQASFYHGNGLMVEMARERKGF